MFLMYARPKAKTKAVLTAIKLLINIYLLICRCTARNYRGHIPDTVSWPLGRNQEMVAALRLICFVYLQVKA